MGHRCGPLLACALLFGLCALSGAARPGAIATDAAAQVEVAEGAQRGLLWFGFNKKVRLFAQSCGAGALSVETDSS